MATGCLLYALLLLFLFSKRAATLISQKYLHLIREILFILCAVGLVLYAGALGVLLVYKDKILYHHDMFLGANKNDGVLPWKNASGEDIGWIMPPKNGPAKFRCLVFHGQGGNALDLIYTANMLRNQDSQGSWEIYLFEYPGYAMRSGIPSEQTLVTGAIEAFDELAKADNRPIFILGQSLGCAVTSQVVSRRPKSVAGMVLVSPFYNLGRTAQYQFPIFPVSLILWNDYRSELALRSYTGPAAFIVDGDDSTIPAEFSFQLYHEYSGPKLLKLVPYGYHCQIPEMNDPWWKEMTDFILSKKLQP